VGILAVEFTLGHEKGQLMDLGILAALALIAVWAVVALGFNGPGWIHLLLTVGVAMLIWRIAARGAKPKPQ
jgi:hypothetical protein